MTDAQLHQIDSRLCTAYGSCMPYKVMYLGEGDKFRRLPNQQILSITGKPDAYRQLRYRRLLFLPRLLKSAPDALLRVLDATVEQSGSYAFTILHDLQWLGQHCVHLVNMESPPNSLHQWLNFCGTTSWRSYLRNAYYNDNRLFLDNVAHETMLHDIRKFHAKAGLPSPSFSPPSVPHNTPPPPSLEPVPGPVAPDVYFCYECWSITPTTKAWHNHRRAKHGIFHRPNTLLTDMYAKYALPSSPPYPVYINI